MTIFEYDQWAVSDFGLQSLTPNAPYVYKVPASELLRLVRLGDHHLYFWIIQVSNKWWVDIESFIAAFSKALHVHEGRYDGTPDQDVLQASFARARQIALATLDNPEPLAPAA